MINAASTKSPQNGRDNPLAPVERSDDQMVILEVTLEKFLLSEGLVGFAYRGILLLPFSELMNAMDFAITVDPPVGQAEGFFISEDHTFSLDIVSGEVVINGKKSRFDPALVEIHEEDIYVDASLFGKWFPLTVEYNLSRQRVKITPDEPLPFQLQLEREQKYKLLGRTSGVGKVYPLVEVPYKFLSWPAIDNNLQSGYSNSAGTVTTSYNSVVSGDLFFMNSNLRLAGSNASNLSSGRITLGRKDPKGGLLGPLHLQEFSLGNTFTPQIPMVAGSRVGEGFSISTFPLGQSQREFDKVNLRGELPLGWTIELYRNETLIKTQTSTRDDGRYEFLDVPLLRGKNRIRLVSYGPQGQKREKEQEFNIGPKQVRPDTQYFRIAANFQDKNLVADLFSLRETGDARLRGRARYSGQYERGVSRLFSLFGNLISVPTVDGRRQFGAFGVRSGSLGALTRLQVAADDRGGVGVQTATQGSFWGINFFGEGTVLLGLESERFPKSDDPLTSDSTTRFNGTIPATFLPRLPFAVTINVKRRESGKMDYRLSQRLSAFLAGVSVSNSTNWSLSSGGASSSTSGTGSFLANVRIKRLSVRGTLFYGIFPDLRANSAAMTGDYNFTRSFSVRGGINQQLQGSQTTSFTASLNRRFKVFSIGVNGNYSTTGAFSVGSSITFSIGRKPRTGGFFVSSNRMASSGSAAARVFLDQNGNGAFDSGEQPLEGIKFRGSSRSGGKLQTDEEGLAFISGLPGSRPASVVIDTKSIEDPLWVPAQEGFRVVSRPGRPALLDFPITPTGEIDGTIYLRRKDSRKAVSNAMVQLVDKQGKVVMEEKTAFDGFYLFTAVPPGVYRVRLSPDQIERLKLAPSPEEEVVIEGAEPIISGVELTVRPSTALSESPISLEKDIGGSPKIEQPKPLPGKIEGSEIPQKAPKLQMPLENKKSPKAPKKLSNLEWLLEQKSKDSKVRKGLSDAEWLLEQKSKDLETPGKPDTK